MKIKTIGVLLGLLCVTGALWAHDVWLVPKEGHLELLYGHETPEPYDPAKIKEANAYDKSGTSVAIKRLKLDQADAAGADGLQVVHVAQRRDAHAREAGGVEPILQRLDDVGRAADGVLIEIEAEFVQAAGGGGRVGGHREDRGPGLDGAFGEFRRAS